MPVSSALTRIPRVSSPTTTSGLIHCPCVRMWVGSFFKENYMIPCPNLIFLITDRSTRPSDSSIENESFVLTYSQRFSKMPEEGGAVVQPTDKNSKQAGASSLADAGDHRTLDKLAKVLKNKNNLILDFKENEK